MGPSDDVKVIADLRNDLSIIREEIVRMAAERPAQGAEFTIAQRAVEDARMRLGVALAMLRGDDPFSFKQPGE